MPRAEPCEYLAGVRDAARAAGNRILEVYAGGFDVEHKADGSPLTTADRVANEVIHDRLAGLDPGTAVVSEESEAAEYAQRSAWERLWLVDPLDGTREFVNRNGEFTVNIALIERGRPVLGVVHAPAAQLTYFACRGQGAFKQRGDAAPERIRVRPAPDGRPIVAASRSHAGEHLAAFLRSLGGHDIVRLGSALKLCLVAEGAADVYPRLGPTMEWDTAAAQCVVEEAGGRVTDAGGQSLVYNKPSLLNPWFVAHGAGRDDWARHVPAA